MRTLYLTSVLLLCAQTVSAQDAAKSDCIIGNVVGGKDNTCISAADFTGKFDLTVPSSALFALMGTAPDTVIRPTVGEKLTTSFLPDLADAVGNKQQGFAVEVRPALFMIPDRYTFAELRGEVQDLLEGSADRVKELDRARRWAPLTATVAVSRGEDDQPTRVGVGFNYTRDSADPIFSSGYGNCLKGSSGDKSVDDSVAALDQQAFQRAAQLRANDDALTEQEALDKAFTEFMPRITPLADRCARSTMPWNRPVFGLGLALYNSAVAPESDAADETGLGFWVSKSLQLRAHGQVILHGRYTDDLLKEQDVNGTQSLVPTDTKSIGARYTHSLAGDDVGDSVNADVIRAIVEIGAFEEELNNVKDEYWQFGVGAEFRMRKNLYFQVLFGDTKGSDQERDVFFNGQIKWSFSSAPAQ